MLRTELVPGAGAPGAARAFVTTEFPGLVGAGSALNLEDVVLVVSELVTNSVRAGATTITVALRKDQECVELVVTDDAAGWPTPRTAGPRSVGGRGLAIVGRLAETWTTAAHGQGKSISAAWRLR